MTDCNTDLREYQHGIDFIPLSNGLYYLFWASQGNPPSLQYEISGNWQSDIYVSIIDPGNPVVRPQVFTTETEAQEPVSAAITNDGHIMVINEDGWNTQNQVAERYGVYDNGLNGVKPYPQMVYDGGHSGHVRSVGNNFVAFWANNWIDGGGVCNLGSGDDVLAYTYDSSGNLLKKVNVAVSTQTRDWWPILAGSQTRAALIWQRYVDNQTYATLMISVLDVASGKLVADQVQLQTHIQYYTYSVEYIPAVDRFLVLGTYYGTGTGFAYLIDENGNITGSNLSLPSGIIRESQSVVSNQNGHAYVVQAKTPSGLMVLDVTASTITWAGTVEDPYLWEYAGVAGIFVAANKVYMVALSDKGLIPRIFTIPAIPSH